MAKKSGAGDGNRTHATSLEGWDSTIELHPHHQCLYILSKIRRYVNRFEGEFLDFFLKISPASTDDGKEFFGGVPPVKTDFFCHGFTFYVFPEKGVFACEIFYGFVL